jgi:tetratricopeptide (TPR) repeat protein
MNDRNSDTSSDSTSGARTGLPAIDSLWNYGDPAASEASFRQVLPDARRRGSPDYQIQLLTQIARAQGLQRHFVEAHATLDEAEALLTAETPVGRIRCLLERGRIHNSAGEPEKAGPPFEQVWDLARAEGQDFYAVDAAHMLGICNQGEVAVEWQLRAMRLAEESSDPRARRWLGPLYNNLGWTYHDSGDYHKALVLFEKGVAWRREMNDEAGTRIARYCVGRALRSLGETEKALAMQRDLARDCEAAGEPDGYVFEEIAECLLALGRAEDARPWFARAYEKLSEDEWLRANEPDRLSRLKSLANGAR